MIRVREIKKRGVSLIEGVLYLVIALAVIVGGIVYFQQARLSNQIAETSRMGVVLSNHFRTLEAETRPSVLMGDVLWNWHYVRKSQIIPAKFISEQGATVHSFDGTVAIAPVKDVLMISYWDLPREACIRLAAVNERGEGMLGTGIRAVVIDGNDWLPIVSSWELEDYPNYVSAPMTPEMAAARCADGGSVTVFYEK